MAVFSGGSQKKGSGSRTVLVPPCFEPLFDWLPFFLGTFFFFFFSFHFFRDATKATQTTMPMNEEEFRSILQRLRQNDAFRDGKLNLSRISFFFFHSKEIKPDKFLQGKGLTEKQIAELCDALKVNKSLQTIDLESNYFVC